MYENYFEIIEAKKQTLLQKNALVTQYNNSPEGNEKKLLLININKLKVRLELIKEMERAALELEKSSITNQAQEKARKTLESLGRKLELDNVMNEKICLQKFNEEQLRRFKSSKKETTELEIHPPAKLWWLLFADHSIRYQKETVHLPDNHELLIIKKAFITKPGSKDESPDYHPESLLWRTSADQLNKAVRYGVIRPQALTGKIISILGTYHQTVFERAYERGTVSALHTQKKLLLDIMQDTIAALQPLERLVNTYDYSIGQTPNQRRIDHAVDQCIEKMQKIKQDNENKLSAFETNAFMDLDIKKRILSNIDDHIFELSKLKSSLVIPEEAMEATGTNSLMTFIKAHIIYTINGAKDINTSISRRLLKGTGRLDSICGDALYEVFEYRDDLHKPILESHQGIYTPPEDKSLLFAELPLSTETNPTETHKLLAAICQAEEKEDAMQSKIVEGQTTWSLGKTPLKNTFDVKSSELDTHEDNGWRVLLFIGKLVAGIALNLVDFAFTLITFYRETPPLSLATFLSDAMDAMPVKKNLNKTYADLKEKVKTPAQSYGTKVGAILVYVLKWPGRELVSGIKILTKELLIRLPNAIYDDFALTRKPPLDKTEMDTRVKEELGFLKYQVEKANLARKLHKGFVTKEIEYKELAEVKSITPMYDLSPGNLDNFGLKIIGAAKAVAKPFTHDLATNNPVLAVTGAAVFAAGFIAVLAPAKLNAIFGITLLLMNLLLPQKNWVMPG